MEHKSSNGNAAAEQKENKRYPTHSRLLSSGAKKIFNTASILHPQQVYTARLKAAEQRANPPLPLHSEDPPQHQRQAATASAATTTTTSGTTKPGEHFEPR
ncbi:fad dependent oxidoreductase [Neofusicoccum parvum]|uniref:Fad dependent oxidoreductase n=1 Tax=Neofusicoccum parvum TaxID=310453 RepID=A0ACB5RY96_9PEZI|nr:fad dependent oxidoreductase [Neofusicoccum parvum]